MEQIFNFILTREAFPGIATLIAGSAALIVYWLHKRDRKVEAAKIILSEIRNAEQQINKIKKDGIITDFSSILHFNNWQKYNHLFVKDLDRDELDLINSFYAACILAEAEIERLKGFLPLAMVEKAQKIQAKLVDLADKHKNNSDQYKKDKESVLAIIEKEEYWFEPHAPKNKLLHYLKNILFVTTTTAGAELKQIAKLG